MRKIQRLLLLLVLTAPAMAQFNVSDINTLPLAGGGVKNCTETHQSITPPGWEYNCDQGSGNCGSGNGPVCANIPGVVSSPSLDGQALELDASWTGSLDGGAIFHPSLNDAAHGDTTDYNWTWGGWYNYTDLSQIWRIELDLNQIVTSNDILILAAQCNLSLGKWQFANGWPLTSNIPCNKTSEFTANTWHHVVINATRCPTFAHGTACPVTYNSVSVDGVTTNCTSGCFSANGQDGQSWAPLGGLVGNVQVDPHTSGTGSMTVYVDLMTVHSGAPTAVATPTFSPAAGTYGSAQSVTISSSTGGSPAICYTTNGSTPTANGGGTCTHGTTYTFPVTVAASETLKAIGSEDGVDFDSATGAAAYVISSQVATPTFSPVAGTYSSTQLVTISTSTGGATLCYTTDGSTPTANGGGTCTHGTIYSTPVSVSVSETLKAIGSEAGDSDSAVGSAAYIISGSSTTPTALSPLTARMELP
jgi:Chitobiase/beta-hexosaminidase C-terminal domain